MKTIILLFAVSLTALSQMTITYTDTVRFQRDSNASVYLSGDIVRYRPSATGGYMFSFTPASSRGRILEVGMFADTSNAADSGFVVMFFSDTTGLATSDFYQLPADNGVFQDKFFLTKYYIGKTTVVLTANGTAAAGATSAGGFNTGLDIYYVLPQKRIYFIVLANDLYTPKAGGLFRVHIKTEAKF